jgi:hypothetical protein
MVDEAIGGRSVADDQEGPQSSYTSMLVVRQLFERMQVHLPLERYLKRMTARGFSSPSTKSATVQLTGAIRSTGSSLA